MRRRTCLLSLLAIGCETSRAAPPMPAAPSVTPPKYSDLLARISTRRVALASELTTAKDEASRRAVLDRARSELRTSIVDVLMPAWLGTRWSFHGTTDHPLGEEGIACGYFVATLLEHAGLRLESRRKYGQATALAIQHALVSRASSHHRILSVPAPVLEQKVRALGEGLYVIGLDVHVGFVVVKPTGVRIVHASYTAPRKVVDENIVASEVIERSRDAGYFVTSLFADDALVLAWLEQSIVKAP